MPELPEYMLRKDKPTIAEFAPEERLFRRVPSESWDDEEIELDAIDFPDMSVTRESLAPATSARWIGDDYVDWGVIGFRVLDIPSEIRFQGAYIYRMKAVHAPLSAIIPTPRSRSSSRSGISHRSNSTLIRTRCQACPGNATGMA